MRAAFFLVPLVGLCLAPSSEALETRNIPVVTQLQGVAFYRTSVTLTNGNEATTTPVVMEFAYRSSADDTFQITAMTVSPPLGPKQVRFFEDIIQEFKNRGLIRAADASSGLYGTLQVRFEALNIRAEAGAVARVYTAAPGGGTLGFAFEGQCFCEAGTRFRALGGGRDGVFGNDGSTRANLGIVNQGDSGGDGATDVRITYSDGSNGNQLKQFFLSSVIGHDLEANEVFQLNNIFNDSAIPSTTTTLLIKVEAQRANWYVSAYVVQLDNTTQDGSFFYLFEEVAEQ
jgi:hypothetical protein